MPIVRLKDGQGTTINKFVFKPGMLISTTDERILRHLGEFMGTPAKLEEVNPNDLTDEERKSVVCHNGAKPVYSLGVTSSSNFVRKEDDTVFIPKVIDEKHHDHSAAVSAIEDKISTEPDIEDKTAIEDSSADVTIKNSTIGDIDTCEPIVLARNQLVELPGITNENVGSVMSGIGNNLDSILKASNVELRKAGVSASYIKRLRKSLREISNG